MTIEIGSISPASPVDRVAAALEAAYAAEAELAPQAADAAQAIGDDAAVEGADALRAATTAVAQTETNLTRHPQAAETLARGGFVERILGETATPTASPPASLPGERVDRSLETVALQSHVRPTTILPERPQTALHADASLPTAAHAKQEFALPAGLLVPVTLVGLQVEPAAGWPLTRRGTEAPPPVAAPTSSEETREAAQHDDDEPPADDDEAPAEETPQPPACPHVFEADGDDAWCAALTEVLREALASKVPPRALLLAAEQWQRGRCVVLACPQGFDAAGPAWAFVLWPERTPTRRPAGALPAPLTLSGIRVDARLQWTTLPRGPRWLHVRVIKEHHPQRGRQLIPNTPGSTGPVECEVQLGPVLARTLRCCDVCVRVNGAQRFWTALGAQWSMQVVVSSLPLLPIDVADAEATPC